MLTPDEKSSERLDPIRNSGKEQLQQSVSNRIAEGLRTETVEELREGFDALFGKWEMTPEREKILKKFNLSGLLLSDEEKVVDSEKKSKRLSQYWQDLGHLSLGVYITLKPATVNIEMPKASGSYKFIFVEPGVLLGEQFTLMAGSEDFHSKIRSRYKENHKSDDNKAFLEMSKGTEQINILWGWRVDLDTEKKHARFYSSSGSYAFVADKVIEWATQSLRDQGRTTEIEMDYRGKELKE